MDGADRAGKVERSFLYTLARILSRLLSPLFFPVRYYGVEHIRKAEAPYVLVSNHMSLLDPVLLAIAVKRYELRFIGKRELGSNPVTAWLFKKMHMISVSRHMTDMAAMRASNQALRAGHALAIFPEGTRTQPDRMMMQVESGFALIALRNRVPLYPAYIHGKPGPFRVTRVYFLPPLDYRHIAEKGTSKEACDELSALLRERMWQARAQAEQAY